MLVGRGAYSYLVSLRRDYRDFHLRAKVRINRGGNSGLYFRAELPADWKSRGCIGYEAEITSTDNGGKTGSLRRYPQSSILKQVDEALVPAGEWFTYDVIAVGNQIETLVNGKPAASVTDDAHAQGCIALQLIREGQTMVEFSRIEIRELVPTSLFAASGWTPLFSGQDLAGWTAHPDEPGAWTVKDSTIVGRGRNHYLYSERRDYQDFWLRAEVKLGAGADSGLLVRMASPSEGPSAESGYEVQLAADPAHASPTASIIRHGSLVGGQAVKGRGDLIQADKWFVLDVAAIGGTLSVAIDGRQVASYRDRRPPIRGHIALQSFSEGTEVSFRKIEISELSAAMDAAERDAKGASTDSSSGAVQSPTWVWGQIKDGWQVGVGWKGDKTRYAPDEPVEFDLKVRNATDAELTIETKKPDDWDLWYSGGEEMHLRILGSEKDRLTLGPREEKTIEVPEPKIMTTGLVKSFYKVRVTTPLGDKAQQPPVGQLGFQFDGPEGATRPEAFKHPDAAYADVAWGERVLGLCLGVRATGQSESESGLEFFLWNATSDSVSIEYLEHHPLNWPLLLRDRNEKEFRPVAFLISPKVQTRRSVDAGAVLSLGTAPLARQWSTAEGPRKLAAGSYMASSQFDCRPTSGKLHVRLTSGEAPMGVK